jgi:preprotein translocase subunit SecG
MQHFFDFLIIGFVVFFIIMILTGHGEQAMNLFSGRSGSEVTGQYDKKKLEKSSLIFCVIVLINELALVFLAPKFPVIVYISLIVTVVSLVLYIMYLRKIRKS